jgi:hypothetical protein
LLVQAKREEAAQAVKTVEATQQAQREAKISNIQAEREAQKAMIEKKNIIEMDALRKQREAEAEAAALKARASAEAEAALKQAETVRTQAQAETEAEKLHAEASKARASAVGLAEADVLRAKAEAAMHEADAVRARALAEAEGAKAKAEALAAYDGVAQRVEILKLQLDAQVQIEIAKADSMAKAMSSMNIKMIGDPNAAASLLRMVTMSDGLGEILKNTPAPVLEVGQQLLNRVTNGSGEGLTKNGSDTDVPPAPRAETDMAELALLIPEMVQKVEQHLNINKLKGLSVGEVLNLLSEKVPDDAVVAKAQTAVSQLAIIRDLPFDDFYLRATAQ